MPDLRCARQPAFHRRPHGFLPQTEPL